MTLSRRGPRRSIAPFGDALDTLMDDPWRWFERWGGRSEGSPVPAIDVRETDEAYVVKAELAGVKPEDVEVTLDGRTLVMRGRYAEEQEDEAEGGRWILRERRAGSFARAITLPIPIEADSIETSFESGELRLTLPKASESRARRIPIGGGAGGARHVGSGDGRSTDGQGRDGGGGRDGGQQRDEGQVTGS